MAREAPAASLARLRQANDVADARLSQPAGPADPVVREALRAAHAKLSAQFPESPDDVAFAFALAAEFKRAEQLLDRLADRALEHAAHGLAQARVARDRALRPCAECQCRQLFIEDTVRLGAFDAPPLELRSVVCANCGSVRLFARAGGDVRAWAAARGLRPYEVEAGPDGHPFREH